MHRFITALSLLAALTLWAPTAQARPASAAKPEIACAASETEIDLQGLLDQAMEQDSPACGFLPGFSCEEGGVMLAFSALIINALAQAGAILNGVFGAARRMLRRTPAPEEDPQA